MSDLIRASSPPSLPDRLDRSASAPGLAPAVASSTSTGSASERLSVGDLLLVLRRRLWLVVATTAAGLGLASWAIVREPPVYRATAVLRLSDARRAITRDIESAESNEGSQSADPLLSGAEPLRSRSVIADVVDAEGLRLQPVGRDLRASDLRDVRVTPSASYDTLHLAFAESGVTATRGAARAVASYGAPVRLADVQFVVPRRPKASGASLVVVPEELAIDQFLRILRVEPRKQSNVVEVSYADPDPARAQRVVNALVDTYRTADIRAAQEQSRRRRLFLETQLRETDSTLRRAEGALSAFRSQHQLYSSRDQLVAQQTAITSLDSRQEELSADRQMFATLLERLRRGGDGERSEGLRALIASPEIGSNPVVAQLYTQLVQYQTQRDSLTTGRWKSATTNPDVTRLDDLIAANQRSLVDAVQSHVASLDARIAALRGLRARSAVSAQALPGTESEEMRMSQGVEASRKFVDHLREEYVKARMAEEAEAGRVEVVDAARRPYRPVPRQRLFKLLLGLTLGLGAGGVMAFALETGNTSFRRRDEVERGMHIPVLAVIPRAGASGANRGWWSRVVVRDRDPRPGQIEAAPAPGGSTETGVFAAQLPISEAYRVLRTNVTWSLAGEGSKIIAVVSALPREGKTTTAANLAAAYAREGKRTLLIDCDLRCARMHRIFHIPPDPGLTQLLVGQVSPATAVRSTSVERLYLLPSGRLRSNASDLLTSARMQAVLRALAPRFDCTVLDCPPILAGADAAMLGALADGVLVVVRAGETVRGAVEQSVDQLASVGARVIGAVLNDPRGEIERYGGAYGAYGYSAYEYSPESA